MFSSFMLNTWFAGTAVAVIAGVTGFFAVLRGSTFAAHAIPNGAFAGAAGAALLGLNPFVGLAVFSAAGALGIAGLSRRARSDVATALTFVLMLGVGALFVSWSTQYAQEAYSLLFGEVFGISASEVLPIAILGAVSVAVIVVMFRPLLLSSALPEVAEARGVPPRRMELVFLLVMALATSMTVPVVGALLMFSLMIGPAAAARSLTARPGLAICPVRGHRAGHGLGRHRGLVPVQLAARLFRRRPRRRVLPGRPGLELGARQIGKYLPAGRPVVTMIILVFSACDRGTLAIQRSFVPGGCQGGGTRIHQLPASRYGAGGRLAVQPADRAFRPAAGHQGRGPGPVRG